jgi:hypothetical protein
VTKGFRIGLETTRFLIDLGSFFGPYGRRSVTSHSAVRPFTMNKKYFFILLCVTVLWARVPAAEGYSVIVLYSSPGQGAQSEHIEYDHYDNVSQSKVEKRALEGVSLEGGVNPKIVLSTGKPGYFAIAVSEGQKSHVFGWAGPLPTAEAAKSEALANCKKRGGTDPRLKDQWREGVHGQN